MNKYREVAYIIRHIFLEFTPLVEPLSLDEAYLDVTGSSHHQGSATLMAQAIRQKIWDTVHLFIIFNFAISINAFNVWLLLAVVALTVTANAV